MEEIRRIGPPAPIAVRGGDYDVAVPLNALPSRAWRRAFQAPEEWKEPCHPSRITVKDRALTFTTDERQLRLWVELIDQWIAAANRKCSLAETGATDPATRDEDARERHQRLLEATDRFRHL